jgi:serine/threonine protein kinase
LILEYNDGSELFDYIAYSGRFSPNIARTYFIMLLNALEYIHKQEIAHRDIKPENILLDKNFNLKVIDFGFSTFLTNENLSSNLGTRGYKAP